MYGAKLNRKRKKDLVYDKACRTDNRIGEDVNRAQGINTHTESSIGLHYLQGNQIITSIFNNLVYTKFWAIFWS